MDFSSQSKQKSFVLSSRWGCFDITRKASISFLDSFFLGPVAGIYSAVGIDLIVPYSLYLSLILESIY